MLRVERIGGYEFRVKFDHEAFAPLLMDEPPPLGRGVAPNAPRLLAAAVANCLAASLLFCLQRAKVEVSDVRADVVVDLVRNEKRRLRIGCVDVTLHTDVSKDDPTVRACIAAFEEFCVVTESVRDGIDVAVHVEGAGAGP